MFPAICGRYVIVLESDLLQGLTGISTSVALHVTRMDLVDMKIASSSRDINLTDV